MTKAFLDTNVIAYANDAADSRKQETAIVLVQDLIRSRSGVVSTQVFMEYAAVARTRLGQSRDAVTRQLCLMERLEVVQVTPELIRDGLDIAESSQLSFWDGVIIAAANAARCETLWTEDLSDGRLYGSVRARNPFN
ncbi:MAG: PIN domain-containing protein [Spirochaetaceae bacterium]|nr:MAG: PIN domain-containing protein [Spirochaetaceae bacterium]